MRAGHLWTLLIAAALAGLAGCGQDTAAPAGSTQTQTSTASPTKTAPTPTGVPGTSPGTSERPGEKPRDPGATPEPPVSLSPSGPVVPAGVTQVPPEQVDSSAVPEYYDQRGQVWMFDDGFSLQMFAMASSGCTGAEAMLVDQSATEVRISLRPMDQPQGGPPDGEMCTTVLEPRPVTVTLDAPLRDRMIFLASGR